MTRTNCARSALTLIWLLGAVVALGLTACGGDDKKKGTAPASTSSAETPTATPTQSGGGDGGGGGATKPGTELAVGETAHVDVSVGPLTADEVKTVPVDATVLKLEEGSIDDFKGIDLDAEQKSSTPYYVSVRLNATEGRIPTKKGDPDNVYFKGIDDRKQEQGTLTIIGEFDRCKDADPPKPFKPGDSYKSCLIYLAPGGGSIKEVHWTGSVSYYSDPVVWK